jgi:hypothetical protein
VCSQSESVAFKKVVMPARSTLGGGTLSLPINSGWEGKDINIDDPVELALAGRLQMPALAHVAGSTSLAYVGPWNAFVPWCSSLMRRRRPLPADDPTVALYFQSLMDNANSFSTIRSVSASIALFHKINLFTNHPTMAPEVCMVRTAAARKFGLSAKRVKEPFLWFQLVDFGILYGNQNQSYCLLVVSTMAILSFGTMCRYSDVSRLKWKNIKFESESSSFEIITLRLERMHNFYKATKS